MARIQMRASMLRPVLALLACAGLLTLAGCGGGSGAPNNPYAPGPVTPGPLFILPPSATVYTATPATLTISGGAPPYQAFSSNSTALPVTQAVSGSTKSLTAVLTPGYAPLEQYSGQGNQGPWSDIYAMAGVLYRAYTSENPPDAVSRLKNDSVPAKLAQLKGRVSAPALQAVSCRADPE